jgi:hypothetical protein
VSRLALDPSCLFNRNLVPVTFSASKLSEDALFG